jgi:putative addiction module component (TIGR02574 family)
MQGCNPSAEPEAGAGRAWKHALPLCRRQWNQKARAMSNLRNEIGNLSAAEKFELLDALWESLEADELTLTEGQREELDYRLGQYERNPDEVIPWEQVRAGLFKKQ